MNTLALFPATLEYLNGTFFFISVIFIVCVAFRLLISKQSILIWAIIIVGVGVGKTDVEDFLGRRFVRRIEPFLNSNSYLSKFMWGVRRHVKLTPGDMKN